MKTTLLYLLTFLLSVVMYAQPNPNYYNRAQGLEGFPLKNALHNIIDEQFSDNSGQSAHNAQSYGDLWELYETSDSRIENGNTFVWDMYSNCDFEFVTDQNMGDNGAECFNFNREHSFPRSWFGSDTSLDIQTDPFHVIPTDSRVNGTRGNLAYGEVINGQASYTSTNGSLIGPSSLQGPTGNVFEPANEFKGDIARQYFYVATRYQDMIAGWETNDTDGDSMLDGSSDKVFEDWALNMLYDWHINDPVSPKEMQRQEAIEDFQGNRNPFIDNPQWVQMIWQDVLSIDELVDTPKFSILPNPASGNEVTVTLNNNDSALIEVYSVLGKRVATYSIRNNSFKLPINALQQGVYLIKIQQGNQLKTLKLLRR